MKSTYSSLNACNANLYRRLLFSSHRILPIPIFIPNLDKQNLYAKYFSHFHFSIFFLHWSDNNNKNNNIKRCEQQNTLNTI